MVSPDVVELARLLHDRNVIDGQIGALIDRPMTAGHAGEWLASRVFGIDLEAAANAKASDGRFRDGSLAGRSVNVKWYLRRENILDLTEAAAPDYYLVLTGPKGSAAASRTARPWRIDAAYLFDVPQLLAEQRARNVRIGTASGVREEQWRAAEVYPRSAHPATLSEDQRAALALFGG